MAAPAENQSATLLIVDDDPGTRERLRAIFENADYRVVTATEASSALRVLKGVRCDLVALDLEMPGVDGLALCKLLRAQPVTSKLPIIALSESDDETRKVQAFTAGADDYITKPFSMREFRSRVRAALRRAEMIPTPDSDEEPLTLILHPPSPREASRNWSPQSLNSDRACTAPDRGRPGTADCSAAAATSRARHR